MHPVPARRPAPPADPAHGPDAEQVAAAFGLGAVRAAPRFAARGEQGRVWRLDTAAGSWAVKELLAGQSEAEAARDVAFQRHALTNGVRLPAPRLTRAGRVLAEVAGTDGANRTVRTYEWIDLEPQPPEASATQAARELGLLHAVPLADDGPVDPWFTEPVPDDRWTDLVRQGNAAHAPWTDSLAGVARELVDANRLVAAGHPGDHRIRCHLDFNPMNVLLDRRGRPVVVDWENCGPATIDQEVAAAVAEFVPDPSTLPDFLDAYRSAGGPAVRLQVTSFVLTLAVQAHLVENYACRSLASPQPQEDRSRAAFWVQDICENLFTLDQVDAWVASWGAAGR